MAIKNWFGGDKKKAEYRDKVKEAVSDGKITPERIAQLEALRHELETSGLDDDKTQIRRSVFNTAVDAVKSGGALTSSQAAELAKVQKFLGLRDDQVDKTRMDLAHLRKMTDVRHGPLPVVSPENSAMRSLKLEPEEIAHYCVAADMLNAVEAGPVAGRQVAAGGEYRPGSSSSFALPVKGADAIDEGVFILTNQRIIFKGVRTTSFTLKQASEVFVYREGLRLDLKKKQVLVKFRAENIADVVATMLTQLLA
ncbi:MAG: hypothetical protein EXR28_02025 [Betaproteobacteria bacterium]|nr:hypothetical protein [Betaproteobacteria bacterium]